MTVSSTLSQVELRETTCAVAGTGPDVVMYLHRPLKRYIVQIVTMKDAILNFTWNNPLKAPIAAPAMTAQMTPSTMLYFDTQQNTMDDSPRIDPWEKSIPPTVIIMKTPIEEIIST